jgi:thioredoxin
LATASTVYRLAVVFSLNKKRTGNFRAVEPPENHLFPLLFVSGRRGQGGVYSDTMETNNKFFDELGKSPRPVVVDFWAPWCLPCRSIEPLLKQMGQEFQGRVDVWRVNADEQPEILRQLRIYGIPTLVAFQKSSEITRKTGAPSSDGMRLLFEAALSGQRPVRRELSRMDRLARLAAGLVLIAIASLSHFAGVYLWLALLGGALMFSGVYDRCPIWRALSRRLSGWLQSKLSQT